MLLRRIATAMRVWSFVNLVPDDVTGVQFNHAPDILLEVASIQAWSHCEAESRRELCCNRWMTQEIMRCMLDSSSRMSFDGTPTRSAISLAAWRAHADAGCSPAGMIAACFESRSAESVWQALLADRKLHGARSTAFRLVTQLLFYFSFFSSFFSFYYYNISSFIFTFI